MAILSLRFLIALHIVLHANIDNVQGDANYRAADSSYTCQEDLASQIIAHQFEMFAKLVNAESHASADHLTRSCRRETIVEPDEACNTMSVDTMDKEEEVLVAFYLSV